MEPEREEKEKRRLRVVLVRWPAGGADALARVLPRGQVPRRDAGPVVVRVTEDPVKAQDTARRLRSAGAGVVVVEEYADVPVICAEHPPELVRGSCRRCSADICATCVLDAEGERLCRRCARDTGARTQRIHTRQLFVVFLFCVFLYQVYAFWRKDTLLRTSGEAIPVAVLQFAPRGARYHPLVRGLSGLDPQAWQGPTYADIAAFFDRERERYTGHASANLDLSVRGPWQEVPVNPALADGEVSALRTGLAALRYSWFWRRVAVDHGVDLRRFPMRLFVIFTEGQGDEAANSRAALSGRLAVTYVSLTDPNPAYPAITIAHELAHLLGAADKYGPDTQSLFPEGFVEPHRDPIYPQRYAELMAVDIPIGRGLEREPASFDQVRFGFRSAAELGWVSKDQADAFYRGAGLDPELGLEPVRDPTVAPAAEGGPADEVAPGAAGIPADGG